MPHNDVDKTRKTLPFGSVAKLQASEPTAPQEDDLLGRRLDDKFVLRELIARGGSGRVFRAEQVALDRVVAVKVLGPVSDRDARRRFHREAYAASRLRHPNVISIYDHGQTDDGLLYIAMEYVSGRTLRQLLHDEFPLDSNRVVALMSQILTALQEAHAGGVVHADLKADNVLVESLRTGGDLVKVIDFGISRVAHAPVEAPGTLSIVDAAERRIATQVTGTPEYMAPEVISGAAPTAASDIYAAGVVLYELLTGVLPFSGDSISVVLARHLEDEIEPLAVKFPELSIPRALERAMRRALAKRPDERFADVATFRDAVAASRVDDSALCEICGARYGARFRFCSECGVRLAVEANSGDQARAEIESIKRDGQRALDRGDASEAIGNLRNAVGMAIRMGDVELIANTYHALATALSEAGAIDAAVLELEEAISVVTAGDAIGVEDLWRLEMLLAELYHHSERHREAVHVASRAMASARQVSSSEGRQAAQRLMGRLYAHIREQHRPPRAAEVAMQESDAPSLRVRDTIESLGVDEDTQPWVPIDGLDELLS